MKICHFIQIIKWLNRLNIFDGHNGMSMKIGEVFGFKEHKLMRSISSTAKSLFIDFKKQYRIGIVKFLASIKYNEINSVCQTWLDLKDDILMSPNNLHKYSSKINCSWLIATNFGSYITLNFTFLEVRHYRFFGCLKSNLGNFIFLFLMIASKWIWSPENIWWWEWILWFNCKYDRNSHSN